MKIAEVFSPGTRLRVRAHSNACARKSHGLNTNAAETRDQNYCERSDACSNVHPSLCFILLYSMLQKRTNRRDRLCFRALKHARERNEERNIAENVRGKFVGFDSLIF